MEDRLLLTAVQSFFPVDGADNVGVDTHLVLTFDGNIQLGTGNFVIARGSDNSIFATFPVASSWVTASGQQVLLDPPGDMVNSTEYYVQIDPEAVTDMFGNSISGIDGPFSWRFTTMTDVSVVPFWNGDATFPASESGTHNLLGGPTVSSNNISVIHETSTIRGGTGAMRSIVLIGESDFGFFGSALAGFGPASGNPYIDTRDISQFESLNFQIRNETGAPFTLHVEIKDYRELTGNGDDHRASASFEIDTDEHWKSLSAPLDLSNAAWDVTGNPDLSRARQILFVIEATGEMPVGGSILVDEVNFVEPGGPVSLNSVTDQALLERLTERTFRGLWGSRDRSSGLVPAVSTFADQLGLNTTAMLVRTLPGAVRRNWISRSDAESYVTRLVATLNSVMDNSQYLPPRTLDRITLEPTGLREESVVDAAFMFLGLTTFRAMSGVSSTLAGNVNSLLDRFDFRPFSSNQGWRFSFRYDAGARTGQLNPGTYDGYSGEVYVISLAAHLATAGHVDITTQFHSADRVLADLGNNSVQYLVHPSTDFRSPFLQWLFPIFVDVQNRGDTTHPDPAFAINPHQNAVRYQLDVIETLTNRGLALQPDAADDGTGNRYVTPSAFESFGAPSLTMPWSAGFGLAANPDVATNTLKSFLQQNLVGPFGPVDSAQYDSPTGELTRFNGRYDLWNTTLWMSAAVEYLYGDNSLLTEQPEVVAALNLVFLLSTNTLLGNVDGDMDFDANDAFLIHLVQLSATDLQIDQSRGSSTLTAAEIRTNIVQLGSVADVDGDGDFDANDSFLIQLVKLAGTDGQIDQSRGSSSLSSAQIRANVISLGDSPATNTVTSRTSQVVQPVVADTLQNNNAARTHSFIIPADAFRSELFTNDEPENENLPLPKVNDILPAADTASVWEHFRHWVDAI
ncbi:MAG: Ig-like domain-containing protein [Fuerstiella sp.]|nr:Ig-like domain-containing protein [Fuerstiella sp.]MCP4856704.1 Ig-like domain-containing protein [Fuerstiella sp.]